MGIPRLGAVVNRARSRLRDAIETSLKSSRIPLLGALGWDAALEGGRIRGASASAGNRLGALDSIVAALEQMSEPG